MSNLDTKIISAFPACGKTYLFENGYNGKLILDSDSSKFSWLADGVTRNPKFPDNYIDHIKGNIGKVDYIFVSSHIDVRNALDAEGLYWCLVIPDKELMFEWVGRCYLRGSSKLFIDTLVLNWSDWVSPCLSNPIPNKTCVLSANEYLSDKMYFIDNQREELESKIEELTKSEKEAN